MKIKPVALLALVGCLLGSSVTTNAQTQTKGKSNSTAQAKKELDEAKSKLKDENQDLDKAEKEADKAEAARKAAAAKVQQARQAALVEHGRKLGLPVATGSGMPPAARWRQPTAQPPSWCAPPRSIRPR